MPARGSAARVVVIRCVDHLRPADLSGAAGGRVGSGLVDRNVCDFFRNGVSGPGAAPAVLIKSGLENKSQELKRKEGGVQIDSEIPIQKIRVRTE